MPNPDITANIILLATAKDGRSSEILGPSYGCPLGVDGAFFDIRFDLSEIGRIAPGESVKLRGQFLDREGAAPHFAVGKQFTLWEGGTIGTGTVVEVHGDI